MQQYLSPDKSTLRHILQGEAVPPRRKKQRLSRDEDEDRIAQLQAENARLRQQLKDKEADSARFDIKKIKAV